MSDKGSNFVGSHRELDDLYKFLSRPSVTQTIVLTSLTIGIEW